MATTDKGRIPNSLDAITGTTTSTGAKEMNDWKFFTQQQKEVTRLKDTITELQAKLDAKQFEIDSLMLEYCPDEMTKEQMDSWGKYQVSTAIKGDKS